MKISLVLLLATGRDIYLTVSLLFPSIYQYFNLKNLDTFYIIIKNTDYQLFNKRLILFKKSFNNYNRIKFKIIKESEFNI